MTNVNRWVLVSALLLVMAAFAVSYAEKPAEKHRGASQGRVAAADAWSLDHDMAFVSVWGSRPDLKRLQGFERAVLFNARGEVVRKLTFGGDSIYSLDRMIQESRARGPLFVRMYRK